MNNEQLKIKQAVLKAVRKISGAAFNKKLGDDFNICFTAIKEINVISMYATQFGEHIDCFYSDGFWGIGTGWQTSYPESIADISRFESEVETALADVFKYVSKHE